MPEVSMSADFNHKQFIATLSHRPGVYRMLDRDDRVLYVGKARDLKKRVASYFGKNVVHPKTQALMANVGSIEVTVTGTEQEALLLEYNLIKKHSPRFNVLLKDGKSYPYIYVSSRQDFPRFEFHRGARSAPGQFFGPFPGAGAVRETLTQIQKLFSVRQCKESYFANRSRPCLQHQIKRCSAPCVGLVDRDSYRRDVDNAVLFLQGRNNSVLNNLLGRMDEAAAAQDYEQAAHYRDQIAAIKTIQSRQIISGTRIADTDVIAVFHAEGSFCVSSIFIRGGRILGSRNVFPKTVPGTESSEVLSAFLAQHYFSQPAPAEILISAAIDDRPVLEQALTAGTGHRVVIKHNVRSRRRRWLEMAMTNAREGLAMRLAANSSVRAQLEGLGEVLHLDEPPERIECFDISHTGGESTVAACVVFGPEGAVKSDYRRFNIRGVPAGDDPGAIAQAVKRRYTRLRKGEAPVPDLLLIDGGRTQLAAACSVLEELQFDDIAVVAVAKGAQRKAGREKLFLPKQDRPVRISAESPAMHLVQQVRDEAHRFAITGHRQRRNLSRKTSSLEAIEGLGPVKRRELLKQFGGLQGVRRAGTEDLVAIRGISRRLAQQIYDYFHGGPD